MEAKAEYRAKEMKKLLYHHHYNIIKYRVNSFKPQYPNYIFKDQGHHRYLCLNICLNKLFIGGNLG